MNNKNQGSQQHRGEETRENTNQDEKRMNTSGGDQGQGNRQHDDMSTGGKRNSDDNSR
jgi:hypothetical protein